MIATQIRRAPGWLALVVAMTALIWLPDEVRADNDDKDMVAYWAVTVSVQSPPLPVEVWVFRYTTIERCDAARGNIQRFFHLDDRPNCHLRFGPTELVDQLKQLEKSGDSPEQGA